MEIGISEQSLVFSEAYRRAIKKNMCSIYRCTFQVSLFQLCFAFSFIVFACSSHFSMHLDQIFALIPNRGGDWDSSESCNGETEPVVQGAISYLISIFYVVMLSFSTSRVYRKDFHIQIRQGGTTSMGRVLTKGHNLLESYLGISLPDTLFSARSIEHIFLS